MILIIIHIQFIKLPYNFILININNYFCIFFYSADGLCEYMHIHANETI
jgi:hypothetical protein